MNAYVHVPAGMLVCYVLYFHGQRKSLHGVLVAAHLGHAGIPDDSAFLSPALMPLLPYGLLPENRPL